MKQPVLDAAAAQVFAADWIAAWNAHDLPRILGHYAADFTMASPFIRVIAGEPSGVLKGHAAVGAYWSKALAQMPDLQFTLIGVYLGATGLVLHYRNQAGRLGAEAFEFDAQGQVCRAAAHYLSEH